MDDMKVVKSGLKRLGFTNEEIHVFVNPDYNDVRKAMNESLDEIIDAKRQDNENTLLFVYYAGHGAMDNYTKIILNEKRMYPLEKILRTLSNE